jgi:hypothetical protein
VRQVAGKHHEVRWARHAVKPATARFSVPWRRVDGGALESHGNPTAAQNRNRSAPPCDPIVDSRDDDAADTRQLHNSRLLNALRSIAASPREL